MKKILFRILFTGALLITMTGCGSSTTSGSTSGNNDPDLGQNASTKEDSIAEDVVDNVGDAAEDVIDGVGNAVDDLVGDNGFDNYSDAHDYFLDTMGNYHSDAKFELRDEKKDLVDYQEGSKGYHFNLYDTSDDSGKMFGEFYVDATSGLIYRVGDDGKIQEYPTKNQNRTNNKKTSTTEKR